MNPDQDNNLSDTAAAIADHLAWARTYSATLRALQQYARESPAILDSNGHFVATITYAMWYALFLKLSHCTDLRKEATGFPKLFKQLRAYLPKQHKLFPEIQAQVQRLHELEAQKKVENWRHKVIAHHTITTDFGTFYKKNVVSLDEVERLIDAMNCMLHAFSIPLWNQALRYDRARSRIP